MTLKRSRRSRLQREKAFLRPERKRSLRHLFVPRVELLEERNLLDAAGPAVLDLSSLQVAADSYDADHILVRFRPEAFASTETSGLLPGTQLGEAVGLVQNLYEVILDAGMSVADALAGYRANPFVLYAEPDYEISLEATPDDPRYLDGSLWGLNNTGQSGGTFDADIDAPEAWDITTGSRSIVVAVIDTGVDYNHPDLAANIWTNPGEIAGDGLDNDANGFIDDIHGYDFVNNDGDPLDDNNHGTHVSGTIGAVGNNAVGVVGVNWQVSIMGLKFLNASGSGSTSGAIAAVNYATMMRNRGVNVRITNNSWGGGGSSQSLKDAIDASGNAGLLFVAAAGNANSNIDAIPSYPASYTSSNIVAVASTTRNDLYSSFSNYGATTVDLAAPGSSILSTTRNNTYSTFSGTSMATPHVAGAAALLWASDPNLSVAEVKARLMGGADFIGNIGSNSSKPTVTNGRLNAANSLRTDLSWNSTSAPGNVDQNQSFDVDWNYRVSGAVAPADFTIVYYLSTDSAFGGDTVLGSQTMTAAGDKSVGAHAGSSPGLSIGTAGSYFIFARIDDGNAFTEFSEANNVSGAMAITVASTAPPLPSLSIDDVTVTEGNAGTVDAVFTVTLSAASTQTVTVNYATANGTATAGSDYTAIGSTPLVFTAGELSKTVTVTVSGDTDAEPDETFFVDLSGAVNANIGDSRGVGTITNDDAAPLPSLSINDVTVTEGNSGTVNATFTVTLSAASTQEVTVNYATANGTATGGSDYTAIGSTPLVFTAGEISQTITVTVSGDTDVEEDETFFVDLSGAVNATIGDSQGVGTISNDDASGFIGADAFGYVARVGVFESLDLVPGGAGVGTVISSGDDVVVALSLGANFNYYGTTFTTVFVSSNGLLTFASGNSSYLNTDLTASPSQRSIAPMWDDWISSFGNTMVLRRFDDPNADGVRDRVVIEWNRVMGYSSSPSTATFQAILQLNTGSTPGTIYFNYPDLNTGNFRSNGGSATIGIKDAGSQGGNRILISFNALSPYVGSGKAIQIQFEGSGGASLSTEGPERGAGPARQAPRSDVLSTLLQPPRLQNRTPVQAVTPRDGSTPRGLEPANVTRFFASSEKREIGAIAGTPAVEDWFGATDGTDTSGWTPVLIPPIGR